MFDLIILDTSVQYFDPLINEVCLPLSDAILFIANLSPGAIYGMTRWIGEVTGSKKEGGMAIDAHKIGVVLNMVMDDVGIHKSTIGDAAVGVKIISMIPMGLKSCSCRLKLQQNPQAHTESQDWPKLLQPRKQNCKRHERCPSRR